MPSEPPNILAKFCIAEVIGENAVVILSSTPEKLPTKLSNVELISDKRSIRYLENYNDIKITEINSSTIFSR